MSIQASKALKISDQSGFDFTQEMLAGDVTYGINFDRVQWHSGINRFIIVELLLTDENQPWVTPYKSHPNLYFHKNKLKFIRLWELTKKLDALLFLVNYAKLGTPHENEVLLMLVNDVNQNDVNGNYVKSDDEKLTRAEYSEFFRKLNSKGR